MGSSADLVAEARRLGVEPVELMRRRSQMVPEAVLHQDLDPPQLPGWAHRPWPHQRKAVRRVLECLAERPDVPVMLDAPPGSGKTLIAQQVAYQMRAASTLYICTTKTLQDQMVREFPHTTVLKGRANYLTTSGRIDQWGQQLPPGRPSEVTCADCTARGEDDDCTWCDPAGCPYRVARQEARYSRFAVLNTAYALLDWSGPRAFAGRELCVVDECDLLPGELTGHVEVRVSNERMRRLGINPPARRRLPKGEQVQPAWVEWARDEALQKVLRAVDMLPKRDGSLRQLRERRSLTELAAKLRTLAGELEEGGWVYDGWKRGDVIFRPVRPTGYGPQLVWPHAERWLLMSGSIVSAQQLADDLGLEQFQLVSVPMTYPASNRPVRFVPVADMTAKKADTERPKMADGIAGVLHRHPDERVLIHVVSYDLARWLMGEVPGLARMLGQSTRRFWTYGESSGRDAALRSYLDHEGSVLIAPSLDRGVDLPGDACRVQVIAKTPWPNLADLQVSARVYGTPDGQPWYATETVRAVVQATGRAVRSVDDWAVCYILDNQFTANLWRKHRKMFPSWWRDAFDGRSLPARRLLKPVLDVRRNPVSGPVMDPVKDSANREHPDYKEIQ